MTRHNRAAEPRMETLATLVPDTLRQLAATATDPAGARKLADLADKLEDALPDRQEAFLRARETLASVDDSPERREALRLVADRLDQRPSS